MPPTWNCLQDDGVVDAHGDSTSSSANAVDSARSLDLDLQEPHDDDDGDATSEASRARSRTLPLRSRLLKRPRIRSVRVPSISTTSLFNRLQTSSLVVVDCRSAQEFAHSHIRGALHCEHGRRRRHKTVDDVLDDARLAGDEIPVDMGSQKTVADKLASRDMMEIVVVGSNRTSSSLLNRMDGGYRFAKLLLKEGRVFSVVFLTAGFQAFAHKYPFMLEISSTSIDSTEPAYSPEPSSKWLHEDAEDDDDDERDLQALDCVAAVAVPTPVMQYPNEIVDDFLYLGNFWQANNAQIVDDLRITHVVNMGAITDDRNKFDHVQYLDVAIKDRETVDIRKEFEHTIPFIQQASREKGARVLIHCVQGVSRSSTIVIWYLMLETKCTLSAAYSYVLKRRPLIFPNRGFMEQLMENEKELYGYESVLPQELDLLQHGLLPPLDRKGSALRLSISQPDK